MRITTAAVGGLAIDVPAMEATVMVQIEDVRYAVTDLSFATHDDGLVWLVVLDGTERLAPDAGD